MQFFDDFTKTESYIGLCALNLEKEEIKNFYKGNYNSSFFKLKMKSPVKNTIEIIDQILYRPSLNVQNQKAWYFE